MEKSLLKRYARDIVALGSVPFFTLVLARVWILKNPMYLSQFMMGGIIVLLFSYIFKFNSYTGISIVIGFFLTVYYDDFLFEVFAAVALCVLLLSALYLEKNKKQVLGGALLGVAATAISFFTVRAMFS